MFSAFCLVLATRSLAQVGRTRAAHVRTRPMSAPVGRPADASELLCHLSEEWL